MKAFRQYPSTRAAWNHNTDQYRKDPKGYFDSIIDQLSTYNGNKFRWHVAGDIPDQQYWLGVKRVARAHPAIYFLIYTKNYSLIFGQMPRNLRLVISAWPGKHLRKGLSRYPIAWLSNDARLDSAEFSGRKHYACSDKCDSCEQSCFNGDNSFDVVFNLH
jgi:hypothetical protein